MQADAPEPAVAHGSDVPVKTCLSGIASCSRPLRSVRSWRIFWSASAVVIVASTGVRAESAPPAPTTLGIDPFYTGSLLSPSPAVPRAGLIAFEPYVIYTENPGTYNSRGGLTPSANETTALQTFTLIKYGITDHLTLAISPQSSENFDRRGFDSGSQIADLPVELEYRLIDQDKKTGKPSLTFSAGFQFPFGRYDNLYNAADGQGSGTYRLRLGALAQSLLFGESDHPVRVRAYVTGLVPLASTKVQNISVFGTGSGFDGTGMSGLSGSFGTSIEYSVTRKLVFALDALYSLSASNHVYGFQPGGGYYDAFGGSSNNVQLAPAVEYSFNDNVGLIAGCVFTVAGHNTSQVVQPQVAVNFVLDTAKPALGIGQILSAAP